MTSSPIDAPTRAPSETTGPTAIDAALRLVAIGPNELTGDEGSSWWKIGPISLPDCALAVTVGLFPVTVVEMTKLMQRGLVSWTRADAQQAQL